MILFNNFVSPADSSKILYLTKNTLRGGHQSYAYHWIFYVLRPTDS